MSRIRLNAAFAFRSDTLANWQSFNPILEDGEVSIVKDKRSTPDFCKIGDGITHWNDLPYSQGPQGDKGDKGDTGSLGSVTASVDNNTGTPSVDVTYDGTNANFAFHNLKGEGSLIDDVKINGASVVTNKVANITIDQEYDGESENAQSGVAVAKVIADTYDDIHNKVDKITGKGLSTNDFTDNYKNAVDTLNTEIENKVDKVSGKSLSTNDFTDEYKDKIDNLSVDQEYDPTSENAQSGVAVAEAVENKVDKITGKGLSTNDYTNTDKGLVEEIPDKLTEPTLSSADVGKYFKIASIDENGHAVLGCAEAPSVMQRLLSRTSKGEMFDTVANLESTTTFYFNGQKITPAKGDYTLVIYDTQFSNKPKTFVYSGESWEQAAQPIITTFGEDGNANIPRAAPRNSNQFGLVSLDHEFYTGIGLDSTGSLVAYTQRRNQEVDNFMRSDYSAIPFSINKFDYATKKAMCDGIGPAWTDEERLAALLRMGCTVDENGFVKWTAQS